MSTLSQRIVSEIKAATESIQADVLYFVLFVKARAGTSPESGSSGIIPCLLQNWEQGHRRPAGTARALLRVAESHPEAVLEGLHR